MSQYTCRAGQDPTCAETCTSLEACLACDCVLSGVPLSGPWGDVMDVLMSLLPILYLIYATVKPNPTPTTVSLPVAAFLLFLIRVGYLGSDPLLSTASVILGILEAITPLSIMAGAILLFQVMKSPSASPTSCPKSRPLRAAMPWPSVF